MARRIFCSEFDINARRLSMPLLPKSISMPVVEKKWMWSHPHKSILDLKPLLLPEREEPITFSTTEPVRPRCMMPKYEEDRSRNARRKMEVVWVGDCLVKTGKVLFHAHATHKDNTSTITGKRREVVRQARHHARMLRADIIKAIDNFDRKEF